MSTDADICARCIALIPSPTWAGSSGQSAEYAARMRECSSSGLPPDAPGSPLDMDGRIVRFPVAFHGSRLRCLPKTFVTSNDVQSFPKIIF